MTWAHRPTGQPGVYELTRDGDVVGMLSLVPEAGWRIEMLVEDAVYGLNTPRPLTERQFEGRAAELLDRRRAKLRGRAGQ